MPKKRIYLDYAAATPVYPEVIKTMQPYYSSIYGNANSIHSFGVEAKQVLETSRKTIADVIKAKKDEIIFTSSATESNNFALKGVAFANRKKGNHIIISAIEHHSVLDACKWLAKQGFVVEQVGVDSKGMVNPDNIKKAIKKNTILVSVMHANNEVGTIQPLSDIGKICKSKKVLFHTDAAQTVSVLPIDVNRMNIDLLTASSNKIYGPKGIGCLYIRQGTKIYPLLNGGGHEFGMRSSTVNVAGVVGFAKAITISSKKSKAETARLNVLREMLVKGVLKNIKNAKLSSHPKKHLANLAHFIFPGIDGEHLLLALDAQGIAVSTGSACVAHDLGPSHVLLACGFSRTQSRCGIRVSLGRLTTKSDIEYLLKVLPKVINKLR